MQLGPKAMQLLLEHVQLRFEEYFPCSEFQFPNANERSVVDLAAFQDNLQLDELQIYLSAASWLYEHQKNAEDLEELQAYAEDEKVGLLKTVL